MAVLPHDIGTDLPRRFAPAAQHQDRARTFQRVGLGNKVVLPAHATEHAATFQLVGNPGAEQGHHDRTVDEPRIQTLQTLEFFLPVQLVDVADARHVERLTLGEGHVLQALVKTTRANEKTAMDRNAVGLGRIIEQAGICLFLRRHIRVDLAPHNPRIRQHQQAVDEHFAATIKAFGKRLDAPFTADQRRPAVHIEVGQQQPIGFVIGLARKQGGGQRIAHRTDTDLQGAAIAHQGAGMQADKMVLETHRHIRCGEQRAAVLFIEQVVERIHAQLRIPRHVGQIGVDLADHQHGFPGGATLGDHRQQVEGDIGVAAQAQPVGVLGAAGHQLRHQVQAGGVDIARGMAVVAADVVLLRGLAVKQATGLHEKLLDVDIRRQAVLVQIGEIIQLGIIAKHPLGKRFQEALLQAIAQRRATQAQGGVNRQRPLRQLGDTSVQRVDEQIGLAQAQGQAHVDMRRQAREYVVNGLLD